MNNNNFLYKTFFLFNISYELILIILIKYSYSKCNKIILILYILYISSINLCLNFTEVVGTLS